MARKLPYIATAVVFALTACGDSGSDSSTTETDTPATTEAAAEKSAMDKATEMATKAVEALKLDASSLDSFKSSLASMQGSLSADDQSKLMETLGGMVANDTGTDTGDSGGGLLDKAKKVASDVASGKSMEEQLYEAVGDKLDGLTFEEILKMAG